MVNNFKVVMTMLAALIVGTLLTGEARAQGLSGAIFTTDQGCNAVNLNSYPNKQAVYLNGGPDHPGAAGLPNGSYYVQVTTPNGVVLGRSTSAVITVSNGVFPCSQIWSLVISPTTGSTGYDDTTNSGGVYKVWVSTDASFPNNLSKTDNFKVDSQGSTQPPQGSVNHPPVISVPGPQTIEVGQTLTFKVTATDQDHDQVALSATSIPVNGSFQNASGMFSFTPAASQVGQVYVVTFTATDTKGASSSATVQITVVTSPGGNQGGNPGGNQTGGPVISIPQGPIAGNVGDTIEVTIVATSPRPNCSVTITVSGPPNVSFDRATGRLIITPTQDQHGRVIFINITATDCAGQVATATMNIIVGGSGTGSGPGSGTGGGNQQFNGRVCIPVEKITFNTTEVGGNCGFLTISLTNEGAGALSINSISLDDGTHFKVEGISTFPMTLQSAGVIQLKIMFTPRDAGRMSDTLTITTNDPDNPVVTIQLKGKGSN